MAIQRELSVPFDEVFPHGAWLVSKVEPVRDFDRSTADVTVQEVVRDDNSQPVLVDGEQQAIWQVEVLDGDEDVTGEAKKVRVKIVSARRPVPPPALPGLPFRRVVLEGLSVVPWLNRDRCKVEKGKQHRCGARQAWSYWATGLRPVEGAAPPAKDGAGNGREVR
jgi:hypothetical protein